MLRLLVLTTTPLTCADHGTTQRCLAGRIERWNVTEAISAAERLFTWAGLRDRHAIAPCATSCAVSGDLAAIESIDAAPSSGAA